VKRIVIGIDPGPIRHAVVAYDSFIVLKAECKTGELIETLKMFRSVHGVDEIACEMIGCYGMPVGREIFQTVMQIGAIAYEFPAVRLIPRIDIKIHLCNSARAKDGNVRQALIDRVGPKGTKANPGVTYGFNNHLWAALGVAVTAYNVSKTNNEWDLYSEHATGKR